MVISNLILALALSTGWGAQGVKPVQRAFDYVYGQECDIYVDTTINVSLNDQETKFYKFDLGYGSYQVINNDGYVDINSMSAYYNFLDHIDFDYTSVNYGYLFMSASNSNIYNGQLDKNLSVSMRVGVPFKYQCNGFELHLINSLTSYLYLYSESNIYYQYDSTYVDSQDNTLPNYVGVFDFDTFGFGGDGSAMVSTSLDDGVPTSFGEFLFVFDIPYVSNKFQFGLDVCFLNFDNESESIEAIRSYQRGYDVGSSSGYKQGFNDGQEEGYQIGKQDGLQSANQGSWFNLFGAIADTPIRMLHGLFNFDLFGISVLSVVLTMLTALIVIGLIKKFYK